MNLILLMTTFLLIRHGETVWNHQGLTTGWSDISLSDTGREQAKELREVLLKEHHDIKAIYSSDLSRAYETAEPLATRLQLPVIHRFDLREMYFGDGEGCTKEEREYRLSIWNDWDQPIYSNGETYNELIHRMRKELFIIAKDHPGQKVAIFSHGRAIHAVIASVIGTHEFPLPNNCEVFVFTLDNAGLHFGIK